MFGVSILSQLLLGMFCIDLYSFLLLVRTYLNRLVSACIHFWRRRCVYARMTRNNSHVMAGSAWGVAHSTQRLMLYIHYLSTTAWRQYCGNKPLALLCVCCFSVTNGCSKWIVIHEAMWWMPELSNVGVSTCSCVIPLACDYTMHVSFSIFIATRPSDRGSQLLWSAWLWMLNTRCR